MLIGRIWLGYLVLNWLMKALVSSELIVLGGTPQILPKGLWIFATLNGIYLFLISGPWRFWSGFVQKGGPFFPLLHLILNLFGILGFYWIGGLQSRVSGLGIACVILVHLVFVKWALLSILRPHSNTAK